MSAALKLSSTPTIEEFDPTSIPFQIQVLQDVHNYDYDLGVHEVLLSGSVGSAKTLLASHIIAVHMIENPGAIVGVGRLALPDLKDTLISVLRDHIRVIPFRYSSSSGDIYLKNGSKMLAFSWIDKRFKKIRSYEFSLFVIEELTENNTKEIYDEIKMRVRLPHVKNKLIVNLTNPDSPAHWAYEYFIKTKSPTRHVYYSRTEENPFLEKTYIQGLKETLDPKMARRMLYGEWIDIRSDVIYYNYNRDINFIDDDYNINPGFPIHISFDFNIGVGKPFSLCLFQHIFKKFHVFDEVVIESTRTEQALEELESRGIFENKVIFKIHGDATGKSRSTNSNHSDYDIIVNYLRKVRRKNGSSISFELEVPASNPPIRTRHNLMNASFLNSNGEVNLYVYRKAKTVDKGLTLTKLKENADYIEDDGPKYPYQHVTTALGYGVVWVIREGESLAPGMIPR